MKVLAINGSPNMDNGNTALILSPFLEGMKEEGAEVELLYTRKLKIAPCIACYKCLTKTPHECIQKDDMQMIIPKILEADILVFATPVYTHATPGPLKNFLDRMGPLAETQLEIRDGRSFHPVNEKLRHKKIVLVSSCSSWELDAFDGLVLQMQMTCGNLEGEFSTLLRPHAEAMRVMMETGQDISDVFDAAKNAGRQLVIDGKMSPETLKTISRELMPLDIFVETMNQVLQQILSQGQQK